MVFKTTLLKSMVYEFQGIRTHFEHNTRAWKEIFDSVDPHLHKYPVPWETKLNTFQKIIILRCLRYDKVIPAIQNLVEGTYH